MKMLKTKHFRRFAVFLAMIAPAVYLFGSLFSGLTGAHGTEVFAEASSSEKVTFSPDDLLNGRYLFDSGEYDTYTGFVTTGIISTHRLVGFEFGGTPNSSSQRYICYFDGDYSFVSGGRVFSTACDDPVAVDSSYPFVAVSLFSTVSNTAAYWEGMQLILIYDGFSNSYGDYVFGQFFDKDNFLVKWGENAISENPFGFAPFGAFWRYLDVNVLHLSNDQMGLMGYGYMYYACHVLLFDVGFILVTFFLDFIQRIADKFTGGE